MSFMDFLSTEYSLIMVTPDGNQHILDNLIQGMTLEENKGELAQKLTVSLRNIPYNETYISDMAQLCTIMRLSANWGQGTETIFDGIIFDWNYTSAAKNDLTLICYDRLIYLQKSKEFRYFSKGGSVKKIISDILNDWNVPLGEFDAPEISIAEAKKYESSTISDMVLDMLKESGGKYCIRWADNKLNILPYGKNTEIYSFEHGKNTIATSDKLTLEELVTRVKIIAKQGKSEDKTVEAVVDGKVEFGILQEVISNNKDLPAAKSEANEMLKERGKPKRTTSVTTPDIPCVRRGDKVNIAAGNLIGYFFVEGVQHNILQRTMSMEVEVCE